MAAWWVAFVEGGKRPGSEWAWGVQTDRSCLSTHRELTSSSVRKPSCDRRGLKPWRGQGLGGSPTVPTWEVAGLAEAAGQGVGVPACLPRPCLASPWFLARLTTPAPRGSAHVLPFPGALRASAVPCAYALCACG